MVLDAIRSESEVFKVTQDSGAITDSNKTNYHVSGRCPVSSATIQFSNSPTTLTCNNGIFDGYLDLSSASEGMNSVQLTADNTSRDPANWNVLKDTTPPVVLVGNAVTAFTGLNKTLSFPVTFSDASAINWTSSDVIIAGTGVNNCSVALSGSGLTARTITLSNCDQPAGNLTISVKASVAVDAAGNASAVSNSTASITIDNVAPTIAETLTSQAAGNSTASFTWQIDFTGADAVSLTAANIVLSGASAGCTKSLSGTGTSQRILTVTGCTANGTLNLQIPAGAATDLANNPSPALTLTTVAIDNQGPTLALGAPIPTIGNSGTTFNWTATYSGAAAITLANSDVVLSGAVTNCAVSVSGAGLSTRTIQVSGCTDTGTVQIQVNAGTASDAAGNLAAASALSPAVTVSNGAVGISLSSVTPSAINAAGSAQYTITYTNAVNYTLTAADISLSGATTACTKALSGSGPTFTVTVANCSGNGNVQISVAANSANDGAGNNAPAAGPSANLTIDNQVPTIAVSGPTPTLGNSSTSFVWTLNFTGAGVVTLANTDVNLSGVSAGCAVAVSGTGLASRTITVTSCTGTGSLDLGIPAGVISDAAGNVSAINASLGAVTLDNTAPTVTIGVPSPTTGNTATSFVWPITYSGASAVTLSAGDVSLATSLTGCVVSISGAGLTNRNVTVTSCVGEDTLKITINAGTASDTAGNLALASAISTQVVVDSNRPTIAFGTPSPSFGNSATSFSWVLTFTGADVVSMADTDVILSGASAGCAASVSGAGITQRTVTVTGCTGSGNLGIQIAADAISDTAGNGNTLTAVSGTVAVSNGAPTIVVTGLPIGHDDSNNVTTNTTGGALVNYVYKIGPTSTTDCSVGTGFSAAQALGSLGHDLSGSANVLMTACFKGQDGFGNWSSVLDQRWTRKVAGGGVSARTNICGDPIQVTNSLSTTDAGGVLVDSGGESLNYVNDNENCTYVIDTGAPITLKFDFFSSESNWDFLKVYDGTTAGTLLENATGVQTGGTFTATSGKMTLVWTSDSSVNAPGFMISWGGVSPTGDDYDPDDFTIANVVNGTTATPYTRSFTVSGVMGTVYTGISGSDAQIKNDTQSTAWNTWAPAVDGDTISIRMTSGATTSDNRTALVRVGNLQKNWKIYWDLGAPTGSISIDGGAANSTTVLTSLDLTAADPESSPLEMYITQTAGCASGGTWEAFQINPPWTLLNEGGNNTVYVKYRDEASNVSACYSDSITQDNLANPVATLTSSVSSTNSPTVDLTITFNEKITGLDLTDFTMMNATIGSLAGSGKVYTATVTPSGVGSFSATLPANTVLDLSGNNNTVSNTLNWFLDNIGPAVTLTVRNTLVTDSYFQVIVDTDDTTVTSVPTNILTVTNGTYGYAGTTQLGATTSFNFSVNPTAEGNLTIKVNAGAFTDAAGNPNTVSNTLNVEYLIRPRVNFATSASIYNEGNGVTARTIDLSISPAKNYSFDVRVLRSSLISTVAAGVLDDLSSSTTVTVPANATTASFTFNTSGNGTADGNKIVQLSLTADSGAIEIGGQDTHTVLIEDDETAPPAAPLMQIADDDAIVSLNAAGKLRSIGKGQLATVDGSGDTHNTPYTMDAATTYTMIAGGAGSGCGITNTGALKCWGWWASDSTSGGGNPLTVQDSGTSYKSIDFLNYTYPTCGITTSDKLRCRGNNDNGQLLTGNNTFQTNFIDVDNGRSYKQVASGKNTICAIDTSDNLYCWGENDSGQAGVGSTSPVVNPSLVDSGTGYAKIYAGNSAFCGITTTAVLKCWGMNYSYSLGVGDTTMRTTPAVVDSGTPYAEVLLRANLANCGLTTGGVLKCWSDISRVMAPAGLEYSMAITPTVMMAGKTFVSLFGSNDNICARENSGVTFCSEPVTQTIAMETWMTIDSSDNWTKWIGESYLGCGLNNAGKIKCITNLHIPTGDGYIVERTQYIPVLTTAAETFIDFDVDSAACAINSSGRLYCWGTQYQISYVAGAGNFVKTPQLVVNAPTNLSKVRVSGGNICVIDTTGELSCAGTNNNGVFGDGSTTPSSWIFQKAATAAKFSKISLANSSLCGITTLGALMCWGTNPGDGTAQSLLPVIIDPGVSYIDVSVNETNKCAVTNTNILKCWGRDSGGMFTTTVNGTTVLTPTIVDSGFAYSKIHTYKGYDTTCGITTAGALRCSKAYSSVIPNVPTTIDAGTTFTEVTGTTNSMCAKTSGGIYKCMTGTNNNDGFYSGYGTGKSVRGFSPVPVAL
jgi:alpha-tubulin suppressor-like RCC1 family protein